MDFLNSSGIPTTLRQVIIPGINDNPENITALKNIADSNTVVDKIELLPFKKICQVKYDNMGVEFPFANIPEPDNKCIETLKQLIKEYV